MEKRLAYKNLDSEISNFYTLSDVDVLHNNKQASRIHSFASDLNILRVSDIGDSDATHPLFERYEDTMLKSQKSNLDLVCLGYGRLFSSIRVYPGLSTDWLIAPLVNDPAFRANNNKLCVPKKVKASLVACVKAGIDFDVIFIAHEIPKNSIRPGTPLDLNLLLPPPNMKQNSRLSSIENLAKKSLTLIGRMFRALFIIFPMVATQVDRLTEESEKLSRPLFYFNYDPILFGVQLDPYLKNSKNNAGLWYYITHWNWEQ